MGSSVCLFREVPELVHQTHLQLLALFITFDNTSSKTTTLKKRYHNNLVLKYFYKQILLNLSPWYLAFPVKTLCLTEREVEGWGGKELYKQTLSHHQH